MDDRIVLSLLVDNTAGVLARVAGLFSRRGYNIESLTVGVTADPRYSKMCIRDSHTGVCYCIYFSSLRYLRGQEASILSYIDPLVAVVVSVLLLHERVLPLQAAGGCMILGFTVLNEWNPGTREHRG